MPLTKAQHGIAEDWTQFCQGACDHSIVLRVGQAIGTRPHKRRRSYREGNCQRIDAMFREIKLLLLV
jgi:hypothetical protein